VDELVAMAVLALLSAVVAGPLLALAWLRAQRQAAASTSHARALADLSRRLDGALRWDSPYEAVLVGRSGPRQVELRAWLDPDMPLPANEPALRVSLLLDPPVDLGRRARVIRLQRGTLDGITLSRGVQPAIDELLRDVDEVLVSAGRLEARAARVEQALAALQEPATVSRLLRQLETLARLLAEHHQRPALRVGVTERSAASTCPYCRTPVDDDPEECPACATLHHAECLREHGRCTVLGCRGRPAPRVQERA